MSTRPHYRRNPSLGRKHNLGLKVTDDIDGHRCYEDETTIDADGNRVYTGNRRTWDRRYDLENDSDRPQG